MVRIRLALALLLALGEAAQAQPRPSTTRMTCAQAHRLVSASGQIVLSTGPYTYERFVTEDIMCEPDATAFPAFEPTLDNRQCFVGYYCRPKDFENR